MTDPATPPDEGLAFSLEPGRRVTLKLLGHQTGHSIMMFEEVTPPGAVIVPLRGEAPRRQIFVACRRGAEARPAIARALDALAESAERSGGGRERRQDLAVVGLR